jgi:hypothetical protein
VTVIVAAEEFYPQWGIFRTEVFGRSLGSERDGLCLP